MKWKQLPLGPLQTNCYLRWNEHKECIIIDPGGEGERLIRLLEENSIKPKAILLTHAHFDHIGAVDDVRDKYEIPLYIHEKEADWLLDPALNGSQRFNIGEHLKMKPAEKILVDEKELVIGDFYFHIFKTPGHSPGSLSYYDPKEGIVFAGDTLFSGSIGRTDLPGGNHQQLLDSIHDTLLTLPEETLVLSGHGEATTIEREMDGNPFLNGF